MTFSKLRAGSHFVLRSAIEADQAALLHKLERTVTVSILVNGQRSKVANVVKEDGTLVFIGDDEEVVWVTF